MRSIDLNDLASAADIKSACMYLVYKFEKKTYTEKEFVNELKELLINIVNFEDELSDGLIGDLRKTM